MVPRKTELHHKVAGPDAGVLLGKSTPPGASALSGIPPWVLSKN
jgi:hypothetical protein